MLRPAYGYEYKVKRTSRLASESSLADLCNELDGEGWFVVHFVKENDVYVVLARREKTP